VIQRFVIYAVLIPAAVVLVTGCASSDSGVVTEEAPASVPGEKVPGENNLSPNAIGGVPSAGVAW
jgi:hypothetical protein